MVKPLLSAAVILLGVLVFSASGFAEVEETHKKEVTPTGVIIDTTHVHGHGSDDLAVGDPYAKGPPSEKALAGHPDTQQAYGAGCTEDRCVRAKNRQLSSPHWQK